MSSRALHRWFPALAASTAPWVLAGCIAASQEPGPVAVVPVGTGVDAMLLDVHFVNSRVGLAVGGTGERDTGVILRSSDGGATWSGVPAVGSGRLYSVDFADDRLGSAVGYGTVIHTADGGESWTASRVPVDPIPWLGGVAFADTQRGFAVGGGGGPVLWSTGDGGATWRDASERLPEGAAGHGLRVIAFMDERHGVIGGDGGLLLATDDGGRRWRVRSTGTDVAWLKGIGVFGAGHGYVVGSHGTVLRTDDSGATWVRGGVAGEPKLNVAGCLDGRRAYAGSMEGRLYATEDGGQTWSVAREELGRALIGSARRPGLRDELWISGERGLLLRLAGTPGPRDPGR